MTNVSTCHSPALIDKSESSPNKIHLNVPSWCAYLCLIHASLDLLRAQPLYVLFACCVYCPYICGIFWGPRNSKGAWGKEQKPKENENSTAIPHTGHIQRQITESGEENSLRLTLRFLFLKEVRSPSVHRPPFLSAIQFLWMAPWRELINGLISEPDVHATGVLFREVGANPTASQKCVQSD